MKKTTSPSRYTDTGVCIDDRIKKGRTFFFEVATEAEAKSREMKSSMYQVFDSAGRHVGYAVPK